MSVLDQLSPNAASYQRLYGGPNANQQSNTTHSTDGNLLKMLGTRRTSRTGEDGSRHNENGFLFSTNNSGPLGGRTNFNFRSLGDSQEAPKLLVADAASSSLYETLGAKQVTSPAQGPLSNSGSEILRSTSRILNSLGSNNGGNTTSKTIDEAIPSNLLQPLSDAEWGAGVVVTSKGLSNGKSPRRRKGKAGNTAKANDCPLIDSIADVRRYFNVKVKHMLTLQSHSGASNAPSAAVDSAIAAVGSETKNGITHLVSVPPKASGPASAAATQALLFGSMMQNTQNVPVENFYCSFCGFGNGVCAPLLLLLDVRYHSDGIVDHCPQCGMYQCA